MTISSAPHFVVSTSHVRDERDDGDDAVMLTHDLQACADAPIDDSDHSEVLQAAPDGEQVVIANTVGEGAPIQQGDAEGAVVEEREDEDEEEEEFDESIFGKTPKHSLTFTQ